MVVVGGLAAFGRPHCALQQAGQAHVSQQRVRRSWSAVGEGPTTADDLGERPLQGPYAPCCHTDGL